jgi:hypothetical protein
VDIGRIYTHPKAGSTAEFHEVEVVRTDLLQPLLQRFIMGDVAVGAKRSLLKDRSFTPSISDDVAVYTDGNAPC